MFIQGHRITGSFEHLLGFLFCFFFFCLFVCFVVVVDCIVLMAWCFVQSHISLFWTIKGEHLIVIL